MQFSRKCNERQPFPDVDQVQVPASTFEDQRLERTDFTIVHDSPSIGAGPGIALLLKTLRW